MPTPLLITIGIVILSVFCIADFRAHVIIPGAKGAYWIVLGLFLALNWLVYITLCTLILEESNFAKLIVGGKPAGNGESIAILVLAIAHFGTGAAPLPFLPKGQSLYDRLLDAFQHIFRIDVIDGQAINEILSNMSKKTEANFDRLQKIHDRFSEESLWQLSQPAWNELLLKKQLYDEELEVLEPLHERVAAPRINKKSIAKEIQKRRKGIDQQLNEAIADYVQDLMMDNRGNPMALREIITAIGVEELPRLRTLEPSLPYRVTIICGFFGLAVGLLLTNFGQNQTHQLETLWVSFITMGLFGWIFSFVGKTKPEARSFATSIAIGMFAGVVAQATFRFLVMYLLWSKPFVFGTLILGGLFGAFAAFVIHFYRIKLRYLVWRNVGDDKAAMAASYVLFAVLGSIGIATIVWVLPDHFELFVFLNEQGRLLFVPCFGAIFMTAAAFATGVVGKRTAKVEDEPPTDAVPAE